ncbi:hypothetical protein DRN69_05390 [Candidatus Pacearchaeota archaeon]|nr:MAG: hypothetical protein DRN69_05390 [Candidatus Pacearchaeota archaeon]
MKVMSEQSRFWNKEAALPSILILFGISMIAQLPHYYYLSEIVQLNQVGYISLVIAFPLFGAIVLTASSLLVTDYLLSRVRRDEDRKLLRYLIRGAFITILIYFFIQLLVIFFGFQAITVFREGLPQDVVNNVTFKESLGIFLLLLTVFFINPPGGRQRIV